MLLTMIACSQRSESRSTRTSSTTTASPKTSTSSEATCDGRREELLQAKRARFPDDSAEKRARVDQAARDARAAGCNVDDLIAPSVGATTTVGPAASPETGASRSEVSPRCAPVSRDLQNIIRASLQTTYGPGFFDIEATRSPQSSYFFIVGDFPPSGSRTALVGIWATASLGGSAPVYAVNDVATRYSSFALPEDADPPILPSDSGIEAALACYEGIKAARD